MDNDNNNTDTEFSFEDVSIDNSIQDVPDSDIDIPSPRSTSPMQSAAQGFKQGFDGLNGINKNNNLALGNNKMNNPLATPNNNMKNQVNDPALDKKNGLNDNNKNNLAQGQNNKTTPQDHKNPLPGANPNKKPVNSPNNANSKPANSDKNKGFNPRKTGEGINGGGIANNIKSRLGLGKNKNNDKNSNGENNDSPTKEAADKVKSGIKNIWALLPLHTKLIVVGSSVVIIILLFLALILLSAITGSLVGDDCDSPSYAVNSSNATEFLCNMSSPFGPNAEGKEYIVTSLVGKRVAPTAGASTFHQGTDVTGAKGLSSTTIYAVADGEVVSAGWNGGYGNSVLIKHETTSTTFYTRYGHMQNNSLAVSKGQKVTAGTKIGIMGNTGVGSGAHLHFELLDEDQKVLSGNPYFGYSDQGYEGCLDEKSSASNLKCQFETSGPARYIGQEGFAQICGRTNAYSSTSSGSSNSCCGTKTSSNSGNIFGFISVWEGGTGSSYQCTTSSGEKGYKAYQNSGDVLTVGPGLTGQYLGGAKKAGDCVAKSVVEENYKKAEKNKREIVQKVFQNKGVTLSQHQEDALTSLQYNGCTSERMNNIASAMKKDNLADVWKYMKDAISAGTQFELGHKRRRKSEFALFVTGDYSEETAKSYKSKNWTTIEYDNYDSEGVMAKKMSGTSANYCSSSSSGASGTREKVLQIAERELNAWNGYSSGTQYCDAVRKYINACSGKKEVLDYCAGFVTYVLKEAGVFDSLGISGGTCVVRDFEKSSKVVVHEAGGSYTPKPGDLFIKVGSKDAGYPDWAHIGFVEKVEGNTIKTIEGNTNPFEGFCTEKIKQDVGNGTIRRKSHKESKTDITHYYEIKYEGE